LKFDQLKSDISSIGHIPKDAQNLTPIEYPCLFLEKDLFKDKSYAFEEIVHFGMLKVPCWNVGSGNLVIKGYEVVKCDPAGWIATRRISNLSISNMPVWLELPIDREKISLNKRHSALIRIISTARTERNNPFPIDIKIDVPYEQQPCISLDKEILEKGFQWGKIPYFQEYRFSLRMPSAKDVDLAGDFTDWKPVKMARMQDEFFFWAPLADGKHRYRFIADGVEQLDPENDQTVVEANKGKVNTIVLNRYRRSLVISNIGLSPLEGKVRVGPEKWLTLDDKDQDFKITSDQRTVEIGFQIIQNQAMKTGRLESRLTVESNSLDKQKIEILISAESSLSEFLPSLITKKLDDAELDLIKLGQLSVFSPFKQKVEELRREISKTKRSEFIKHQLNEVMLQGEQKNCLAALEILKELTKNFPEKKAETEDLKNGLLSAAYKQIEEDMLNRNFDSAFGVLKKLLGLFPERKEELGQQVKNLKDHKEYFEERQRLDGLTKEGSFESALAGLEALLDRFPDKESEIILKIETVKPRVEEIIFKKEVQALLQEAESLTNAKRWDDALQLIEKVLQIRGDHETALRMKAEIENKLGLQALYKQIRKKLDSQELEEALAGLAAILQANPRENEALGLLKECVSRIAEDQVRQANALLSRGDFAALVESAVRFRTRFQEHTEMITDKLRDLDGLRERAVLLHTLSSLPESDERTRKAIAAKYLQAYGKDDNISRITQIESQKDRLRSASAALESRQFRRARTELENIQTVTADLQKAVADLATRIDLQEKAFVAERIGTIKDLIQRNDLQEAQKIIASVRQAVEEKNHELGELNELVLNKKKVGNLLQYAKKYLELGDAEMAAAGIDEVLKIEPEHAEGKALLEEIGRRENELRKAEEARTEIDVTYRQAFRHYDANDLSESKKAIGALLAKKSDHAEGLQLKRRIELKEHILGLGEAVDHYRAADAEACMARIEGSFDALLKADRELGAAYATCKERYGEIHIVAKSISYVHKLMADKDYRKAILQAKSVLEFYPDDEGIIRAGLEIAGAYFEACPPDKDRRKSIDSLTTEIERSLNDGQVEQASQSLVGLFSDLIG
jgi:hypothetical protein